MTALVTGASSGIGHELARVLARYGWDVVLTARNAEALGRVAAECSSHGVRVDVVVADLADPAAPSHLVDELRERAREIDILINNAGFGNHGRFDRVGVKQDLDLLQVNVIAMTLLTKLLLPGMIHRRRGRILNVASTAAFVPGPYMSTYYASKAYVLSHSLALARELRGTGVTVTALCPGPTATDFQRRANIAASRLFSAKVMSAATVARAGYQGMMRGTAMVVPGAGNKFAAFASRFSPRMSLARIAEWLNRDRSL